MNPLDTGTTRRAYIRFALPCLYLARNRSGRRSTAGSC